MTPTFANIAGLAVRFCKNHTFCRPVLTPTFARIDHVDIHVGQTCLDGPDLGIYPWVFSEALPVGILGIGGDCLDFT